MIKLQNKIVLFLLFFFVLSLIKTDFRFDEIFYGESVDDAEYYYHAVTLALDFDLDYSNQMAGVENRFLNFENDNIVPFHPLGSGVLSFPFVLISDLLFKNSKSDFLISYNYFFYSLASIFYLFISLKILSKVLQMLNIVHNKLEVLFLTLSTGVAYFAFERFSMSHIYEFFSVSVIILLTLKIFEEKTTYTNTKKFFLSFLGFVFLSIRWTNYFLFLVPFLFLLILNKKFSTLLKNKYYLSGGVLGASLFLMHTKYLYGIYTFNQAPIVLSVEGSFTSNYERFFELEKILENISFLFGNLLKIFFTYEFGIFYFAPILFISVFLCVYFIYTKKYSFFLIYSLILSIPFLTIMVVQNTAFSYGFRYLFALIPLNIILYFIFIEKFKYLKLYVYIFSLIGLIGYIVFETSTLTSLSEGYVFNTFGMETRYSNPEYLKYIFVVLLDINTYAHIIFTSFLGVLVIKVINEFTNPELFLSQFTNLNEKTTEYIENYLQFSWTKLFFLLAAILFLLSYYLRENKY